MGVDSKFEASQINPTQSQDRPIRKEKLNRRDLIIRAVRVVVLGGSIGVVVNRIFFNKETKEAEGVKALIENFPREIDGAEMVSIHESPGAERLLIIFLCPHRDSREDPNSLSALSLAVEEAQEGGMRILRDLEQKGLLPTTAYAEGIPYGSDEATRRKQLMENPHSPETDRQRTVARTVYGPLFERWISGLTVRGVEDIILHQSVGGIEKKRYDPVYGSIYFQLQKERSSAILNAATTSEENYSLLQIGPYPHGENLVEEIRMRNNRNEKPLSCIILIPKGTKKLISLQEKEFRREQNVSVEDNESS